jgi:hypothetical protein
MNNNIIFLFETETKIEKGRKGEGGEREKGG